jgi:hypothetical protein
MECLILNVIYGVFEKQPGLTLATETSNPVQVYQMTCLCCMHIQAGMLNEKVLWFNVDANCDAQFRHASV